MKEGVIWILIGCGICFLSWRIDIGSFREPGPGFVAFIAGIIILITGFLISLEKAFKKSFIEDNKLSETKIFNERWFQLIYTMGLLVIYSLMVQQLGYILTTFIIMFGLFYNLGKNKLFPSILASFICVTITYILFELWLKVQLPRGILPWW